MYVFRYVFQEITASSDLTLRDKQIETSAAPAGNTIWTSRYVGKISFLGNVAKAPDSVRVYSFGAMREVSVYGMRACVSNCAALRYPLRV